MFFRQKSFDISFLYTAMVERSTLHHCCVIHTLSLFVLFSAYDEPRIVNNKR